MPMACGHPLISAANNLHSSMKLTGTMLSACTHTTHKGGVHLDTGQHYYGIREWRSNWALKGTDVYLDECSTYLRPKRSFL